MTHAQLGAAIGSSRSAVASWVNGTNMVSLEAVPRIDAVLGCRLLEQAGIITARSLLDAIDADGSLDELARGDLRATLERCIADTARRRIAEVASDGDATETHVALPDGPSTEEAALRLLVELFGPGRLAELGAQITSLAAVVPVATDGSATGVG